MKAACVVERETRTARFILTHVSDRPDQDTCATGQDDPERAGSHASVIMCYSKLPVGPTMRSH